MADQDLNNNSAPDLGGDDTRTRKTVRLAPSVNSVASLKLPGKEASGNVLADPLANRDTDTGNLDVLDDTQTRKTVKLKPIKPQDPAAAPNINLGGNTAPAPAPATITPRPSIPKADGSNTNTRKTVVLKPAAAPSVPLDGGNTNTRKTVVLKPAAAPSVPLDGSNTNTRKTVVLKPAAAPGIDIEKHGVSDATQVNARIKPNLENRAVSDATQVNARIKPAEAANDDRTVKIARPPRLTPAPQPAPAPASEAAKETLVLPEEEEAARATVVLPEENEAAARATVVLPEMEEEDTRTRKNIVLPNNAAKETVALSAQDLTEAAEKAVAAVGAGEEPDNAAEQTIVLSDSILEKEMPFDTDEKNNDSFDENFDFSVAKVPAAAKASPVYMVLMIVSLLAVSVTAVLTTFDYLGTWENVKISLPLPGMTQR
jgi:hypothetical protein